jgi:cell division protein FtsB
MFKNIIRNLKNRYTLTFLAFVVWVSFFDKNDLLSQMELRTEVKKLESEKKYFVTEISKNKTDMKELITNPRNLEKFAREKYLMKRDNEDVFVLVDEKK